MRSPYLALGVIAISCAGDPTAVEVQLSPSVISSLDGTTSVAALIRDLDQPLADIVARATVSYTDRNGVPHEIEPVDGTSDDRGVFHADLSGLSFDGTGVVTVEATGGISGSASFSVLDRTPPQVVIDAPSAGAVGPGLPLDVRVHATDEIGISELTFSEDQLGSRTTIVASGQRDVMQTFRTQVPDQPTIDLHALAIDLSGNIAVATTVTLTIDPGITIATPPELVGSLVVTGSATQLVSPRALVMSAKDNHLYVADAAGVGACDPSCIWRIDPTTGAIDATPVVVGQGVIEGVAVDATSDNLFFSDRSNRVGRLTWNGTAYASQVACADPAEQAPQDPMHLVIDGALGILIADDNSNDVIRVASCSAASTGTTFSVGANLEKPRGIALGALGEIYVSEGDRDRVSRVERTTGATSVFQTGIAGAYGMEWLSGGASAYADSLLVASADGRTVESTRGLGNTAVAFLRTNPVDLALDAGSLYILTAPGNGSRGRIYKVTGF